MDLSHKPPDHSMPAVGCVMLGVLCITLPEQLEMHQLSCQLDYTFLPAQLLELRVWLASNGTERRYAEEGVEHPC